MPETLKPFKGADLVVTERIIIPPREYGLVPVLISPEIIPSAIVNEVANLGSTGRSRNAQLHLEMLDNAPQMIARQIADRGLEGSRLSYSFPAQIAVRNYANRPIDIGRVAIGRLYRTGPRIEGEELADLISDGTIHIGGRAWRKRHSNGHVKTSADLVGATVRIDSTKRMGIPVSKEPLKLSDVQSGGEYRDKIDEQLTHLPDSDETVLWIGNTGVEIGMSEGIDAVLHKGVYSSPTLRTEKARVGEHINALLLDGGKRPWLIRVEVWGKTKRGLVNNFIDIDFLKAAKNPSRPPEHA